MDRTRYSGKEITIGFPPAAIYSFFEDMSSFGKHFPAGVVDSVTSDSDSIHITKSGLTLGIRRGECIPHSKVSVVSEESSPLKFSLSFLMSPSGTDGTTLHLELDAEMNMMMKMMLGGKLQEAVDKLTFYMSDISADMLKKLASDGDRS